MVLATPPEGGKIRLNDIFSTKISTDCINAVSMRAGLRDEDYRLVITISGKENTYRYRSKEDCEADLLIVEGAM